MLLPLRNVAKNKRKGFLLEIIKCLCVKVITEKLSNGETETDKNDRKNDQNWLILVLNDSWHYEKDCKNTSRFDQLLYFSWGE